MSGTPMFTLQQAHALVQARIPQARLVGGPDALHLPLGRVHTDTRTLQAGDLFVALRGERFDANEFL
ncbi:UDP-N-acetylmuramoylalanyl-D-glutamyl-2, 6-diaminopimelate--D-alanyl-D-alanine ligase, partial [Paracidovorax avenae]